MRGLVMSTGYLNLSSKGTERERGRAQTREWPKKASRHNWSLHKLCSFIIIRSLITALTAYSNWFICLKHPTAAEWWLLNDHWHWQVASRWQGFEQVGMSRQFVSLKYNYLDWQMPKSVTQLLSSYSYQVYCWTDGTFDYFRCVYSTKTYSCITI